MNILIFFLTALIPIITGFIWYSPPLFLKPWMRASGLRPEDMGKHKMGLVLLLCYILGCMLTVIVSMLSIHQLHIGSIFAGTPGANDPSTPVGAYVRDFMARYGSNYRTFRHGAFHGTMAALFFALPVIGINALFERKRFSYVAIHTGYWILTIALMGGVICRFIKLS